MHVSTATHGQAHHGMHGIHPLRWLARAFATRHQRMRLDELDDYLLRDIGIDRSTARAEARRAFWDLP